MSRHSERYIDGNRWISIRPNHYSILDHSLRRDGLISMPPTLLGAPPCEVILDAEGKEWFYNLPDFEQMMAKTLQDTGWFYRKAKERGFSYKSILTAAIQLQKELSATEYSNNRINMRVIDILFETVKLYNEFVSYTYLSMFDREMIDKFIELLSCYLDEEISNEVMSELICPPSYFSDYLARKIVFADNKDIQIPPEDALIVVKGNVDIDLCQTISLRTAEKLDHLLSYAEFEKVKRYIDVLPLLFQMGQENIFMGKSLQPLLSYCFTHIASVWVYDSALYNERDILNLPYDEVLNRLGNCLVVI